MGDPKMLELNTTRLDGKGLTAPQLQMACGSMPFLSKYRLVLVDNFLGNKPDKKVVKAVTAYLPTMPDFTRLLFLENGTIRKTNALYKLADADKRGYVKVYESPKGNDLVRWVRKEVAARDGKIAPRAAHMLATNVGSDLLALTQEIEKLTLYKNGELIQAQDVMLLSPYSAEANIFDLVDALGSRNGKKAVLLLQQKLSEGESAFQIFSMFVRQFRLIIQTKACAEQGMRPNDIAEAVGMHSFVAGKVFKQSKSFSMAQLQQIYRHLLDMDVDSKTGRTDLDTALNLFIASLST